jgi:hypothetical protein
VLLRLAYLGVTNVFALMRLLPVSSRDKDAEILVLRHQLSIRSLNRRGNALSLPSRQLRSDRLVPSVSLLFC